MTTWRRKWLAAMVSGALTFALGCNSSSDDQKADPDPTEETQPKHCAGVKIVYFPGGSDTDSFARIVYNGARAAETDLGPSMTYKWSNWSNATMVTQFGEAVASAPDGIAMMGHPGDAALQTLVDQAAAAGIIVTSQNTPLEALEAKYKDKGFGYVGQELYASGKLLGEGAIKRFSTLAGGEVIVWGFPDSLPRGSRTKGVADALIAGGMTTVHRYDIGTAMDANPAQSGAAFAAAITAHPTVKLIVTDHGGMTSAAKTLLEAAGKTESDIVLIGFDLSSNTAEAISQGWVDLVLDQQPFLQGYLPVLQICLTKLYGFAGLHIDTGSGLVHKDNVASLLTLIEQGVR